MGQETVFEGHQHVSFHDQRTPIYDEKATSLRRESNHVNIIGQMGDRRRKSDVFTTTPSRQPAQLERRRSHGSAGMATAGQQWGQPSS
jgi:hypothetical protein